MMFYRLLKGENAYFNSIYEYAVGREGQIKPFLVKTKYMKNNKILKVTEMSTVKLKVRYMPIYKFS